jgi:hypothetical protein
VLKKDIHTKDKHKFSSTWEDSFIIVDVATSGTYVLAEIDDSMLPNVWNIDQLHKYYVQCISMINKDTLFLSLYLINHYISL